MTFGTNTSYRTESGSSDIPAELSKRLLEAVELSDIEMDDDNDMLFDCSPSNDCESSDENDEEQLKEPTVLVPSNISMLKKLEQLEQIAINLETMCESQMKKTEEVEKSMIDPKTKEDERPCVQQCNSKSPIPDIHSQKLLQFIKTCLNSDSLSCANIISYTDEFRKTEFKINDPEKFAILWGKKKGKETMTVRKLARSFAYLVKNKQQLVKVSRWKYRIVDRGLIDFVSSSRTCSPCESSSNDNTVDMQYESAECSPTNSERSLESSFNSTHTMFQDHFKNTTLNTIVPSPICTTTNAFTDTSTIQESAPTSIIDWLNNSKDSLLVTNGIKTIANDAMSPSKNNDSIFSTPLLAISQESSSTGQSFKNNVSAPETLETLTKFLTLNPISEDTNKILPSINDNLIYTYCINPSQLSSSFIDIHNSQSINKTPKENTDNSLPKATNDGYYTGILMENPLAEDNIEMAMTQVNVNPDIHYGTVNNIVGVKDFDIDLNYPEVDDLFTMSRSLSNDPINFDLISEDFKSANTLFDEDIFDIQ